MSEKILSKLKKVVEDAQDKIDTKIAKNPSLRKAISVVEEFLRHSGRVCYGGQAINSYLPKRDQFYNPEKTLPDYDFFSPNAKEDTKGLILLLKDAGYTEISKRIGIHEGTVKIYVNYFPVADITEIDSEFYSHIRQKAHVIHGIHYTDPIFLRMMMYLELSRPEGMIKRWDKVYQRLDLLDKAQPLKMCKYSRPIILKDPVHKQTYSNIMEYVIANNKVFMGANIYSIYNMLKKSMSLKSRLLLKEFGPVIFLSNDAEMDANILKDLLDTTIEIKEIIGYQSILPAMKGLYKNTVLLALIVQEEACHSYITIPVPGHKELRVASLDTLLTFLIGLYYRADDTILPINSLLCWIQIFNDLSKYYRVHPTRYITAFPTSCSGYQTSFASLLRAKGTRIEAARQKLGSLSKGVNSRILTRKRSRSKVRSKVSSSISSATRKLFF